jgi:hypothetical protein
MLLFGGAGGVSAQFEMLAALLASRRSDVDGPIAIGVPSPALTKNRPQS